MEDIPAITQVHEYPVKVKKSFRQWLSLLLLFLVLFPVCSHSQEINKQKSEKAVEKAWQYYSRQEWDKCKAELNAAFRYDSTNAEPYVMMAEVLMEQSEPGQAVIYYKKALERNPERWESLCYVLANTLFSLKEYEESKVYYDTILKISGIDSKLTLAAQERLGQAITRSALRAAPVAFNPVNLGIRINTSGDEYINAISTDGQFIFFTRRIKYPKPVQGRNYSEDLYIAEIGNNAGDSAALLTYPPGKENDAGSFCLSPDGRMILFTACNRSDSYGSCDLYYSEKINGKWSVARNLGRNVNSESWDAQPSISPDGRKIYFASNRAGGWGNSDIWVTERDSLGHWQLPVNLGRPVNSSEAEMVPVIHFDNQTLYFSSKSHPGMGGADLFMSSKINQSWTKPVNLGYPLNTEADELAIIVNASGKYGFISSNTLEGSGGYDIYSFSLNNEVRPVPVTYFKGMIYDSITRQPLKADFEMIDTENDTTVVIAQSDDANGEFLVCIPCNRNYALNVSREGYLFYSAHFPIKENHDAVNPVVKNIGLIPIAPGNTMILRNIFFEKDQYILSAESTAELTKLLLFLNENPSIRIEIGGHTDSDGPDEYNLELSRKRAEAVYIYLTGNGISTDRLTFKGYGESEPISDNETWQGKARNRRTEVKIVSAN